MILFAKQPTYLIIIEGRDFMAFGYKVLEPTGKATLVVSDTKENAYDRVFAM